MRYIIIVLIIIILLLCLRYFFTTKERFETKFMYIDLLDVKNKNKTYLVLQKLLKDINGLFEFYNIHYWIDGDTLLQASRYKKLSPLDAKANLCIYYTNKKKLLGLKNRLNEMGYNISKSWAGYRIYPINGIDVKYYNKEWTPNEVSFALEDDDYPQYYYPYINIFLCSYFKGKIRYQNRYLRSLFRSYYYKINNLFPLKKYRVNDFYLWGPNNPEDYLIRNYGRKKNSLGYPVTDHHSLLYDPLVKGKVNLGRN